MVTHLLSQFFYQFPIQYPTEAYPCYIVPQIQENNSCFFFDPQTTMKNNIIITGPSQSSEKDRNLNSRECKSQQGERSSTIQNLDEDNHEIPIARVTGEKKGKKKGVEQ